MKHGLILALALALASCATLERHPILTAVGVGIVAGSLAASDSRRTERTGDMPSMCRTNPDACR